MKKVLVLDFDGLICDALKECILVTWNGFYGKGLAEFSDQGLAQIPKSFIERFTLYRNFSKHLGHFLVSLYEEKKIMRTQQEFNEFYATIDQGYIEDFVRKVSDYRNSARNMKRSIWLQYHTLYPGIEGLLQGCSLPMYIITAKDSASVVEILSSRGVAFPHEHVFGEQTAKLFALQAIQRLEQVEQTQIHFFDDNIFNVLEAQAAHYQAYWATWGYNMPEHFHLAQEKRVATLYLRDFVENKRFFS
jgi:phosphoglycolate phosphatase-like HAD superfamily hydrolase